MEAIQNPIKRKKLYDYLSENDMTDLSFDDFSNEYGSNIEKQSNLYSYLKSNNLTDLDSESFASEYFGDLKKKEVSDSSSPSTLQNEELVSGTTDGSLGISEDRPTYNLEDKYRLSPEEWLEAQERGFAPPPSVEISLSRPKMDSSPEDYMNQSWEERQGSYTPFKESFVKSDNLIEKVGTGWKPETNEEKSEFSRIKSLDFQMKDLNIQHPYKYFSEANKSDYNDRDEFIENNFGYDNLISMGIDPVDFDGFINKKGYKEDFSDKESRGLFESSDYSFDHNLAQEQERYRMLSLYIADMNKRAVLREKLNAEIESGTPADMPDPVFIFNEEEVSNFIKNEFPIYSKVVEERKEKEKEILKKHIDGEAGFWFRVGGMVNRGWDMFAGRINDISATSYDKIGFDTIADEIRYSKSQSELAKPNDRLVSYVSGKSGEHNGRQYLVDSKGRVIDSELKIDVTDVLDSFTYKDLMLKSKDWEDDWTLSGWGMATETAGVATDLIVQIAATAALSRIGIKPLASSMIAQGALGYSQGLEDGMNSAREYGLTESESAEFASSLAREMGTWYVLTSVISPQTKGADAMFGISKKKFMEDAVKAYSRTDKKALGRFVDNVAENYLSKRGIRNLAVDFNIEGSKEAIQENIQQLGEVNIKQRANRISGQEILEAEDMTGDDIFNTTIISYIVGGIPSILKFSSNRTTDKLLLLKSVNDSNVDVVGVLDNLEKEEVITNEFRREFEQDLKAYRNNINKIPDNLDSEIALEVLNSLERINELETKKESLDSAFHSEVDEEIKSEREKISDLTKRVKKEASKSESTTDTEVETEPSSSQSTALDSSETTTAQKPEAEEEVSDVKNKPETEEEISEAETDRDLEEVIGVSPDEVTDFDNVLTEERKKLSDLESKHGANHRLVKEQRAVVDALEKNAPISVSVENGKIVVKGRGSDNQKTRKEAIQKAIDEGVIDEIPPTNMEGANYGDVDKIVASESHNPIEVAASLDNVRKEEKSKGRTVRTLETARDAVLDYFASGGKISTNILQQLFGNKRGKNIQGEIQARLTLLSNSGPVTVDGLADEIWNLVGEELGITDSSEIRQEIEDVLLSFETPKQMREELYGSDGKTPLEVELEMKFEELTGLKPNQSNIEMFFKRNREEDSNSNQDPLDDIPFQSTKETFKPISRRKLNQLIRGLQRAFKKAGKKVRVHTGAKKMANRLKELSKRGYNTPRMQYEYRISHTAPTRDDGLSVSIDRLNEVYPDDVYSNMGWYYYGDGDRTMDKESHAKLRSLKGKPDAKVTIYRAVPKGVTEINDGDWITINRNYAVSHGESHIDGDYDIISLEVRADQVFTDANSLHEQGIQFLQTKDGTIYGFVDPVTGDIYMDGDLMNANTPIHEFAHLWISSVQQSNPQLWERMVNVAKETPEWSRLANDPNYKQGQFKDKKGKVLDNAIADEVWASIIGNRGENNFEAILEKMNGDRTLAQKVWDAVQDFWQAVVDLFYDAGIFSGDVTLPNGVRLQASVFHGSPHTFDRFSTDYIGTGEGAQAFGWGLYFTDLESIASSYAKMGTKITVDGKEIYSNNRSMLYSLGVIPVEQDLAYNSLIANFGNVDMAIKTLMERGNTELINNAISILNNSNIEVSGDRNLYSVTLHKGKTPDQYTWLEWDKKFSELPQNTREALLKLQEVDKIHGTAVNLEVKDYTIEHFYKMLSQSLGSPQAASLFLLENGIDGIKYPAESISRGATSDNARGFNYVVFDENAVTIEEHTRFQQGNQTASDQSLQNPEVAAIADMALEQMMSGEFDGRTASNEVQQQFIGEKGAMALDKAEEATHRMDNLGVAREMENANKTPKEIRMATGWERGADGKWRYEITDYIKSVSDVYSLQGKKDGKVTVPASTLVSAELNKAYPDLKNITVEVNISTNLVRGGSFQNTKINEVKHSSLINVDAKDFNEAQSILLHEIQHAIQDIEGFAKGGSPTAFSKARDNINRLFKDIENVFDKLGYEDWLINGGKVDTTPGRNFNGMYSFAETQSKSVRDRMVSMLDEANKVINENKSIFGNNNIYDNIKDEELYRRLAGEVEARNVQTRMDMTPEQRRETLLSETEDVAREDQIFLNHSVITQSMASLLEDGDFEYDQNGNVTGVKPEVLEEIRKEREQIETEARANGTWMKAPNGENTNLNEDQWVTVRTSRFKEWFGDWENDPENASKMVDTNGEPKLFYHRTNNQFSEFDVSKQGSSTDAGWLGEGFYFYGVEEESYGYGDIEIVAFLNIREPYYATSEENSRLAELNSINASKEFSEDVKSEGYDGVFFNEDLREETVVFNPNQIKSATDNAGTFSNETGDIRFQKESSKDLSESETQTEKTRAEKFLDLLDSWEREIDKFGKETMGVNIPVVVAKGMIRMMRISVKGGMNITQAFNAGMDYIRETDWYKKLSETDKEKVEAKTFRTVITNAVRQAIDAENQINKIREKLNELTKETEVEKPKTKDERVERAEKEKRVRQEVVNDLIQFLSKNKIEGKITPTEVNRLIKYASRIATDSNAQKAFDRFLDAFNKVEINAARRANSRNTEEIQRKDVTSKVDEMLNTGMSESDIINSFETKWQRDVAFDHIERQRDITDEEASKEWDRISEDYDNKFRDKKPLKKRAKKWVNAVRKALFSSQIHAEDLTTESGLRRTRNLLRNFHGAKGLAKTVFDDAYAKIWGVEGGRKGHWALNKKLRRALDDMIFHRRVIELENDYIAKGKEPIMHTGGWNKKKAEARLREMKRELGEKTFNDLMKRSDIYFDTFKKLLKDKYDAGLISKESYESMKDLNYSPRVLASLLLDFDGDLTERGKRRRERANGKTDHEIKSLGEGSLEHFFKESEWLLATALNSGYRNIAQNRLNNMLFREMEVQKERFEKIDAKVKAGEKLRRSETEFYDAYKELSEKIIENPIIGFTKDGNPKYQRSNPPSHNFVQSYRWVDGVRHSFFVESKLAEEWFANREGFINPDWKRFFSIISGSALVKYFATGNNPFFFISNTPRDAMYNYVFSDEFSPIAVVGGAQMIKESAVASIDIIKHDFNLGDNLLEKLYEYGLSMEFLSTQGRIHSNKILDLFPKRQRDNFQFVWRNLTLQQMQTANELMFRVGLSQKAIYNFLKHNGIRDVNQITEDLAKDKGYESKQDMIDDMYETAVSEARGILDFSRGGTLSKDLEAFIPYTNVSLQSTGKLLEKLGRNPKETTFKIAQVMGIMSLVPVMTSILAISLRDQDDEDKDKSAFEIYFETMDGLSKYERTNYSHIPLGMRDENGNWMAVRIAKEHALTAPFAISDYYVQNMLRKMNGIKEESPSGLQSRLGFALRKNYAASITPQDIAGDIPILRTLELQRTGYDSFRDQFLPGTKGSVKYGIHSLQGEGLTNPNVEEFWKAMGEQFYLSPIRTKYAVESIITSPSTNPMIGLLYGGADVVWSQDKTMREIRDGLVDNISKSPFKRVIISANDYNRGYAEREAREKEDDKFRYKLQKRNKKENELIEKRMNNEISMEEFLKEAKKIRPEDPKKVSEKLKKRIKDKNVSWEMLNLRSYSLEERARAIWEDYGDIRSESNKEIRNEMRKAGGILTENFWKYYRKEKNERLGE